MYAVDMLGVLGLPEDLIEEVRGMLGAQADDLESAKPSHLGAVFGGSAQGGQLNYHANLARQHVAEAVLEMAAGLRGFQQDLGAHHARMGDTDVQNAVDMRRIEDAAECVAPTSFATNTQCALPTSADGQA